jgi:3-oxoacyl-[acyl-carrier protein] reductase
MDHHGLSTVFRAGVHGFLKHLANEIAHTGVTVNVVCPASVATEALANSYDIVARAKSIPLKRIGKPEELASAVAYFASQQAGFITGTTLQVDGGMVGALN